MFCALFSRALATSLVVTVGAALAMTAPTSGLILELVVHTEAKQVELILAYAGARCRDVQILAFAAPMVFCSGTCCGGGAFWAKAEPAIAAAARTSNALKKIMAISPAKQR